MNHPITAQKIAQFYNVTGETEAVAVAYLESEEGNLSDAVYAYRCDSEYSFAQDRLKAAEVHEDKCRGKVYRMENFIARKSRGGKNDTSTVEKILVEFRAELEAAIIETDNMRLLTVPISELNYCS